MNELLRKDKEAVKQKLCVKTYLVVPLSQKTGVIQWCDNTAVSTTANSSIYIN